MAIRDLLWACPLCGAVDGIKPAKDTERCTHCDTVFLRAGGSMIQAVGADGVTTTRPAGEWADMLPPEPPGPAAGREGPAGREGVPSPAAADERASPVWRSDRVFARFAVGEEAIRHHSVYLGMMERLAKPKEGTLTLTSDALRLKLDNGEVRVWPLEDVAALQASGRTVQVRPRRQPIVSFSFPDTSARLWDESIAAALKQCWRRLGRGEIIEFQPRIVAR
ncbi:MAG TPA: hypothetical protein VF832_11980 [Longimicrobiales bacterium]